ncbi:MAG: DUF4388 domain-containing protein [Myxococcota bacterium]
MALKGTLKDFGISDIFQLIGQQGKTGVLMLKNAEKEVRIHFKDGNVIKADSSTRDRRELLGAMLVRAEVISQAQLDAGLDVQRRTLRRLGDILIENGACSVETLQEFTKLQTTETIYKLFLWSAGTYEFTQTDDLDFDTQAYVPIRSESVLMEGFRMVDEWPMIRKKVSSYGMTFRVLKQLPEAAKKKDAPAGEQDFLAGIDDAFGAMESGSDKKDDDDDGPIGPPERKIFALVQPGRDVQKLIDLSRLGEFETCKAISNLVSQGYLEAIAAAQTPGAGLAEGGALEPPKKMEVSLGRWLPRVLGAMTGAAALVVAAWIMDVTPASLHREDRIKSYTEDVALAHLAQLSRERIERALEVYRLQNGTYPETLQQLVDRTLLTEAELRQPFERPFSYSRRADGYVLVRPFY